MDTEQFLKPQLSWSPGCWDSSRIMERGTSGKSNTTHGKRWVPFSPSQWKENYLLCSPYLVRFCLTLKERLARAASTCDRCYYSRTGRCCSYGCGHGNHNIREPPFLQEVYWGGQTKDSADIRMHGNDRRSFGVSSLTMAADTFPPKEISTPNGLQRTPSLLSVTVVNMSPAFCAPDSQRDLGWKSPDMERGGR